MKGGAGLWGYHQMWGSLDRTEWGSVRSIVCLFNLKSK